MERDATSKRNGFTQNSYLQVLQEHLFPLYDGTRDFQQDNAKIHMAKRVTDWFLNYGVSLIDWPAHSPDLNPIEHVWKLLKDKMHAMFPDLWERTLNEDNLAYFKQCAKTAWWAIDQKVIDNLILSMPKRLQACKRAKGWYTKY